MRPLSRLALLATLALAACGPDDDRRPAAAADSAQRRAEEQGVRAFMHSVAADITRDGPAAWRAKFTDGPEFFMASDGLVVFADAPAAVRGLEALTHALPKIELHFGDDLRVDTLTPELAVVGSSYSEVQTDAQGEEHAENGYFTGVAQLRDGHWRFRSAHWSSAHASNDRPRRVAGAPRDAGR